MSLGQRPDLTLTPTEQWQPIRRIGRPRIDAAAAETCNVRITLAVTPSSDWREAFFQYENGVERSTFMFENPCLVGNTLSLCGVREQDVEFWFRLVDTKIAGANVQYTDRTLPTLAAVQELEAAEAQRQRDAQDRVDQIAERWQAPDA
jgi:hypothetical protein